MNLFRFRPSHPVLIYKIKRLTYFKIFLWCLCGCVIFSFIFFIFFWSQLTWQDNIINRTFIDSFDIVSFYNEDKWKFVHIYSTYTQGVMYVWICRKLLFQFFIHILIILYNGQTPVQVLNYSCWNLKWKWLPTYTYVYKKYIIKLKLNNMALPFWNIHSFSVLVSTRF